MSKTIEKVNALRTLLIIEYLGENFNGVNKQKNIKTTVQEMIERYVGELLKEKIETYFMSRTDTGVNAYKQICEVRNVCAQRLERYRKLLNHRFRKDSIKIQIIKIIASEQNIKKISKTYLYKLAKTNSLLLQRTHINAQHCNFSIVCELLEHLNNAEIDYSSFCSELKDNRRPTIMSINYVFQDINKYEAFIYVKGKYFMYKQIRNIIGTIMHISSMEKNHKIILENIIIAKDRTKAYDCAEAHGLYVYDFEIEHD